MLKTSVYSLLLQHNPPPLERSKKILLHLLPWALAALLLYSQYTPDLTIWPQHGEPSIYSDSTTLDKGNSGIRQLPSSEGVLKYEYCLGGGFQYSYIGISFNAETDTSFFDLSKYDKVEIELDAHLSRLIPVILCEDLKGFSQPNKGSTYRPLTQTFIYKKGQSHYELPLSMFEAPSWWYSNNHLTENEIGKPVLSRIHSIQFQECQLLPNNVVEQLSIYSFVFKKDMGFSYAMAALTLFLYYILWYVLLHFPKPRKPLLPRKELVVLNVSDETSQKVLSYLAENYSNPDLALEVVQKDLGLSETKISSVIKEASGFNFKRYLNNIRLEEAKRLLHSTDRPIMDIAYKVGYGNISHFNRVFKETEGCSPNEYRKNSSQKE